MIADTSGLHHRGIGEAGRVRVSWRLKGNTTHCSDGHSADTQPGGVTLPNGVALSHSGQATWTIASFPSHWWEFERETVSVFGGEEVRGGEVRGGEVRGGGRGQGGGIDERGGGGIKGGGEG